MCAGGAFYIVGGSDVVIASDDATFFEPHVDFGLVAALEPISITRRMLLGEILRVSLMGVEERMSAQHAHQIGLVSELLPHDSCGLVHTKWRPSLHPNRPFPLRAPSGLFGSLWIPAVHKPWRVG